MTLNVWGPRARAVHVAQRHERAELHGAPLQRPRVTPHFSSQAQQALTVRALASGPALQLDTSAGAWSPKGHRLAYVVGANLRVLDMPTGAQTLDVALPSTDGQLGSPSWSPDGRFVLFDGNVVDVAAGRVVELPPAGPYGGIEWRPQRGHLLLRSTYKPVTDLVDAAVPSVLWYRPGQSSLSWSPDGRWLLRDDYENPRAQVLDAKSGRAVPPSKRVAAIVEEEPGVLLAKSARRAGHQR